MRHIPDEELHAYQDQALSRSQCIEIESHLAICLACRRNRDAIAALRDRTTRLLAVASPRWIRAPAWTEMEGQAMVRRQRRPWRRTGLWAASIAGAVLAGWGLRALSDPHGATGLAVETLAPTIVAVAPGPELIDPVAADPAAVRSDPTPALGSDVGVQLASNRTTLSGRAAAASADPSSPPPALALDERWTTVTVAEAEDATGHQLPAIPDLPVILVRLRRTDAGRPLVVVTQSHPGGEPVHTVEGPPALIADVVAAQLGPEVGLSSSDLTRSTIEYTESAGGVRRTSRALAVLGRLPLDSLNVLATGVVIR